MLTAVYILCNFYNCLWLLFPQFGKLSRVMSAYKYNMLEAAKGSGKTDRYVYIYLQYLTISIYVSILIFTGRCWGTCTISTTITGT